MSEKLPVKMQSIFHQAKRYAERYNYKYCGISCNTVYLKKDHDTLPVRITSKADLLKLLEDDFLNVNCLPLEGDFEVQLFKIVERVRLTDAQIFNRDRLIDDLTNALETIWTDFEVRPFGSTVSGVGLRTSDVDCYVHLLPEYRNNALLKARIVLRKNTSTFAQLFAITHAKVPILKFIHVPTGFKCDVNFSNPSGVRNSKLVAFLLRLNLKAEMITILLKYWSKVYDFTGTNLMSCYALVLMVIFYLQVKTVLPSVAELQQDVSMQLVNGWNTAFDEDYDFISHNNQSLYELLGGFFQFYQSFDYARFAICPYLGYPVERQRLRDLNALPREYWLYRENVVLSHCDVINLNTAICIQDPFDHSKNCAGSVYGTLVGKIRGHIAIVHRQFCEKPRDGFLRSMFTHKLVYEPVTHHTFSQENALPAESGVVPRHNNIISNNRNPMMINRGLQQQHTQKYTQMQGYSQNGGLGQYVTLQQQNTQKYTQMQGYQQNGGLRQNGGLQQQNTQKYTQIQGYQQNGRLRQNGGLQQQNTHKYTQIQGYQQNGGLGQNGELQQQNTQKYTQMQGGYQRYGGLRNNITRTEFAKPPTYNANNEDEPFAQVLIKFILAIIFMVWINSSQK